MLRFERITDIESAKRLWNTFSPGKSLYESWEFRLLFFTSSKSEPLFIVGFDEEVAIGLCPLQYNHEKNVVEFFGGQYMENNRIFIKPGYEKFIPHFYEYVKTLPEDLHLEYIVGEDDATKNLPVMDEKFFLPTGKLSNLEDYFQKYFSGETRGKMRRKMRHIESEGVRIVRNKFEDIESLFAFNKENFKETSTFYLPHREKCFRTLLSFENPIYLLSFYFGEKLSGVSLSVLGRDGTYEYLNLGVSPDAPRDMRSYIHLKNIETALIEKAQVFNAGCSDCGWKELFHLEKSPQYKFDKTVELGYTMA